MIAGKGSFMGSVSGNSVPGGGAMSSTLQTAMTTAFTGVRNDVLANLEVAVPAALGIVAVVMAVKIGIKFFKSIANA